jgi:hypothetical protein
MTARQGKAAGRSNRISGKLTSKEQTIIDRLIAMGNRQATFVGGPAQFRERGLWTGGNWRAARLTSKRNSDRGFRSLRFACVAISPNAPMGRPTERAPVAQAGKRTRPGTFVRMQVPECLLWFSTESNSPKTSWPLFHGSPTVRNFSVTKGIKGSE